MMSMDGCDGIMTRSWDPIWQINIQTVRSVRVNWQSCLDHSYFVFRTVLPIQNIREHGSRRAKRGVDAWGTSYFHGLYIQIDLF
jgi:hypothetical protein